MGTGAGKLQDPLTYLGRLVGVGRSVGKGEGGEVGAMGSRGWCGAGGFVQMSPVSAIPVFFYGSWRSDPRSSCFCKALY